MRHVFPVLTIVAVAAAQPPAPVPKTDAYGDPLPPGVVSRLGSVRFRAPNDGWDVAVLGRDGARLLDLRRRESVELVTAARRPLAGDPRATRDIDRALALSADGTRTLTREPVRLVVRAADIGAEVFDVALANPVDVEPVRGVLSPDGTAVAVIGPKRAAVWREGAAGPGVRVAVPETYADAAFAPDGRTVAVVESDGGGRVIRVYVVADGTEVATLQTPAPSPHTPLYAPDGKTVAAFDNRKKTVSLHDPATGKLLRTLTHPFSETPAWRTFTPDGSGLVATEFGGEVVCLDLATGKARWSVPCPGPTGVQIRDIRFTAPNRAVVWGVFGPTAYAWEVPSGRPLTPAEGHADRVNAAWFAAGGAQVLTRGQDRQLIRWDAATGKSLGRVMWDGPPLGTIMVEAVSGDGRRAVIGPAAYDLTTGKRLGARPTRPEFSGALTLSGLSADGSRAATVGLPYGPPAAEAKCVVWDATTGAVVRELTIPRGARTGLTLSADGSRVVVVSSASHSPTKTDPVRVTTFDAATGAKVGDFTAPGIQFDPAVAADGATVVFGSATGGAVAYDLIGGKAGRVYGGPRVVRTYAARLSGDGRTVAVAEADPSPTGAAFVFRVYDRATGAMRREQVCSVGLFALSPDGTRLVTSGWPAEGAATAPVVWDVSAGAN